MTFRDYDVRNEDFDLTSDIDEERRINNLCRNRAFPQTGFLSAADGNSINSWATFDVDCLFREYTGREHPGALADKRDPATRDVTERTLAGYIMADYDADPGNIPVRGNIGGTHAQPAAPAKASGPVPAITYNAHGPITP